MGNLHSIEIFVLAASAVYVLGLAAFLPGLARGLRRKNDFPFSTPPKCTILICARNEEENIGACLNSLSNIQYPTELLEILVVDDSSTDTTPQILHSWKAKLPNLRTINTQNLAKHKFEGKVSALIHGMDVAQGEFVLITDADCTVGPNWVHEHIRWYKSDTGMVLSLIHI